MNPIEINTTLTRADWQAYQAAWAQRMQPGRPSSRAALLALAGVVLLALALTAAASYFGETMPFIGIAVGAALSALMLTLMARRIQRRAAPDADGAILGPCTLTLNAEGIRQHKRAVVHAYDWSLVQDATVSLEHLFIWIDRIAGLIVPLRDLPAQVSAADLLHYIRERAQTVTTAVSAPAVSTTLASGAEAHTSKARSAPTFLKAIGRLLTLRTTQHHHLELSDRALTLIVILAAGLWLAIDRVSVGGDAIFYFGGVLALSWCAMIAVITALIVARLSDPPLQMRAVLTLAIAFAPIAITASAALPWIPYSLQLGLLTIFVLYAALYLERGARSLTGRAQPRAVLTALLLLAGAAWLTHSQYFNARFWYPAEYEDEASNAEQLYEQWRSAESTLFQQAERIDAAVAKLERPVDVSAAAFFIGFAGFGEERVFATEIALAEQAIAHKFGAGARSLRLVNDRRDLNAQPLASATALRYALQRVAARMNLERDVLFLALSSHGFEDGELAVSNSNLPLNPLSAAELSDALREAGVQWKVLIISACYSGAFIEPLRDERTIILTAAAADRASFGCSDQRDLTYFGEAFYRDALPKSTTLRAAFDQARRAIAAREQQEDREPSHPQAHFGAALEAHLQTLSSEATFTPPIRAHLH